MGYSPARRFSKSRTLRFCRTSVDARKLRQTPTMATLDDEYQDQTYALQVGLRLRAVRRQRRFSLNDVEASSMKEFKASVLGAYERGDRAISVQRLQRLASFYSIPVDSLLPPISTGRPSAPTFPTQPVPRTRGLTIDLVRLESISSHEANILRRYVAMIRAQRSHPDGGEITMRREDLAALAALLEGEVDDIRSRLEDLGHQPAKLS